MSIRKQERFIRSVIRELGLERFAELVYGGKHFRVELRNGERKGLVSVATTPGEYRSNLNFRSTLRREAALIGCMG